MDIVGKRVSRYNIIFSTPSCLPTFYYWRKEKRSATNNFNRKEINVKTLIEKKTHTHTKPAHLPGNLLLVTFQPHRPIYFFI